jgi:hypothetical protein
MALHAALGLGRAGKAHDRGRLGRCIGSSTVNGSHANYYTAAGSRLGYAERVGGEVVIRDTGGRVVARFRVGA